MTRFFRVLIIDDDEEIIKRIPERVSVKARAFENRTYRIDLRVVRIRLCETQDEQLSFDGATFEELASACSQCPHLILADYGYTKRETIDAVREITRQGKEVTDDDLFGKVMTLPDLVQAIRVFANDDTVEAYKRNNLNRSLLKTTAKLYLYSYTAKEFMKALGEPAGRAKRVEAALPNCSVTRIDTKYEFYNGAEFDWPNPSKHDTKFYAHLIGGLINELAHREFLEFILTEAVRLKYIRVQRSVLAVALIVALGGAIGACAQWLGGRAIGLASTGLYVPALIIIGLTILFIFILGVSLPFVFERIMSGLLATADRSETDTK
jgi:hypothetical protein